MFKKVLSVAMMVAIILTTLTFSSCGGVESKNPERPKNIPMSGTTESDLSSDEYRKVSENDKLEFWFNDYTTDIKIVNKQTGYTWTSEYYDSDADEYYKGQIISLQYTDKSGAENEKITDVDSIENGQYKITDIDNGIKVQYGIGDVGYEINFPMALSVKRYNEIVKRLGEDSDYAYTLTDYYEQFDFSTEEGRSGYEKDTLQ